MANEDIVFKVVLESDVAEKSVGDLKQDFKDLQQQLEKTKVGTEEYRSTLKSLGVVKGEIVELKEQIKALNPEKQFAAVAQLGSTVASGFASAQGAMALFGSESEDLQRVLLKVQAATALASGLQGLAGFSKALRLAGIAMQTFALSNPFTAIAAGVVALTAAAYAMVQAMDDSEQALERLNKQAEKFEETTKSTNRFWESRIKLLKASGASIEEIASKERMMYKQQIEDVDNGIRIQQKLVNAGDEQAIKKLNELKARREDILLNQQLFEINLEKDLAERKKKADDDEQQRKDLNAKKESERKEKERQELLAWQQERNEINIKANEDNEEKRKEDLNKESEDFFQRYILDVVKQNEINEKQAKEDIDRAIRVKDTKLQLTAQTFGAIGDLANAFAGENEAGAKRAFEINKAASIAQAIISTYQGANAIFASAAANPSTVLFPAQPFITAGLAIAAGIANVAKIAKTQWKSTSISGGSPSFGGGSAPSIQSPQAQQQAATSTQTQTNSQGDFTGFKQEPIKAYVVETEVTSAQQTVGKIKHLTTF